MSDLSKIKAELYAALSILDEHQDVLPDIIDEEKELLANAKKVLRDKVGNTSYENLIKLKKTVATHKENVELFLTLQKTSIAINKLQVNWLCRNQALEFALGRTGKTSSENINSDESINNEPEAA